MTYEIKDYPIEWRRVPVLPFSSTANITDEKFSNLSVTYDHMTYMMPNPSHEFDAFVLRKLNALNSIWKRINYIMIGEESNVNITRTFIMMQEVDSQGSKEMLATFPGQQFEENISTETFMNFPWYKEAFDKNTSLIKIDMQPDPFNGGLGNTTGF